MWRLQEKYFWTGRRALAAGACLIAVVVLVLAWIGAYERREILGNEQAEAALLARVLEDHATRTLESAGIALTALADIAAAPGAMDDPQHLASSLARISGGIIDHAACAGPDIGRCAASCAAPTTGSAMPMPTRPTLDTSCPTMPLHRRDSTPGSCAAATMPTGCRPAPGCTMPTGCKRLAGDATGLSWSAITAAGEWAPRRPAAPPRRPASRSAPCRA